MLATIKKKLIQRMVFEGKDENPHLLRSRGPGLAAIGLDRPGSWAWTQRHQKKTPFKSPTSINLNLFWGMSLYLEQGTSGMKLSVQNGFTKLECITPWLDHITSRHTSRRTFPRDPRPPKSQSPHPHPACIMDSLWWYNYNFRVWAYTFEQKRRNGKRDGM